MKTPSSSPAYWKALNAVIATGAEQLVAHAKKHLRGETISRLEDAKVKIEAGEIEAAAEAVGTAMSNLMLERPFCPPRKSARPRMPEGCASPAKIEHSATLAKAGGTIAPTLLVTLDQLVRTLGIADSKVKTLRRRL